MGKRGTLHLWGHRSKVSDDSISPPISVSHISSSSSLSVYALLLSELGLGALEEQWKLTLI